MGPAEVSSENRRSSGLLKKPLTGCSKRSRGEAREKSTSGGVHRQYVDARRWSATMHMGLFQQPARRIVMQRLTRVLLILLLAQLSISQARAAEPSRISFGFSSIGAAGTGVWMAKEIGAFE